MKMPDDVRKVLHGRFQSSRKIWLKNVGSDQWPMVFGLDVPTDKAVGERYDATRAWVDAWNANVRQGDVRWEERRWRSHGAQRVPTQLVLHGPEQVADWVGELERWNRAKARYMAWVAHRPILAEPLAKQFDILADYAEADFRRLHDAVEWLVANPASGLYVRQLPIIGLDSKWIEVREALVASLVTAIQGREKGEFHAVCGVRQEPQPIRLRVLDAVLRAKVGGLCDFCAPPDELASLDMPAERVFIVENLQTGLAFPELPGSVVFMGKGYDISKLAQLPWVMRAKTFYWGDLDTHGFAILSRIRGYLPSITSLMMDEETLLEHRELWVEEEQQHRAEALPGLTPSEQEVYRGLRQQLWGPRVRMEQERILWMTVEEKLRCLNDSR